MLSILKTTSQNFGLAIQDQISIKHKLENIEGLPTLELDFLSTDGQDGSTVEPTERPTHANLHQKQQIAKNALEKKYKVKSNVISLVCEIKLLSTFVSDCATYYCTTWSSIWPYSSDTFHHVLVLIYIEL